MEDIKYTIYLADPSTIEHHGKAETCEYQLCFPCAVIRVTKGFYVNQKLADEHEVVYCDDCIGDIPEGAS